MAKIMPLEGKYYGTVVEISTPEGLEEIQIWCPNHFAVPFGSSREIANGWEPPDGHDHVEDDQSLRVAQICCAALTAAGY